MTANKLDSGFRRNDGKRAFVSSCEVSMDERQKRELIGLLNKNVHFNCPMAPYTTFRVGGNAEALCAVKDLAQLMQLLAFV